MVLPSMASSSNQPPSPRVTAVSFTPMGSPPAPPTPDSPALGPVSPRGYSNISSLASSFEAARPLQPLSAPPLPAHDAGPESERSSLEVPAQDASMFINPETETQALMQMLSMVGSRFFEAERHGILSEDQDQDQDQNQDEQVLSIPSGPSRPFAASSGSRRPYPFKADLFDEAATPQGELTPMAASTVSFRSKRPLSSHFGTQSEAGAEPRRRRSAQARRQPQLAFEETHAAQGLSDDGADGDSEDSLDLDQGPTDESISASQRHLPIQPPVGTPSLAASASAVSKHQTQPLTSSSAPDQQDAFISDIARLDLSGIDRDRNHAEIALQLRALFDLEANERLISAHQCWMFRSILLQGHIYLTSGHLCFYAYMPSRENRLLRSGHIAKLTSRTKRFSKHWATLKSGFLSWFDSERDPYFPQGHIDLRKVSSVEASFKHPDRFKVITPYRRFVFQVDTELNRNAWINSLRKEIFRAQNEGESVNISVPLETIIDVDTTLSVDQTEMVCVKVVDEAADFTIDEYFFLHLSRKDAFIDLLRQVVFQNVHQQASAPGQSRPRSWSRLGIRDSTGGMQNTVTQQTTLEGVPTVPLSGSLQRKPSAAEPSDVQAHQQPLEGAINIVRKGDRTLSPDQDIEGLDQFSSTPRAGGYSQKSSESTHTYPPSPSSSDAPASFEQIQREAERGWSIPRWIRETPSKVLASGLATDTVAAWMGNRTGRRPRKIIESWPDHPEAELDGEGMSGSEATPGEDMTNSGYSTFSVLDAPEEAEMPANSAQFLAQFRETFGLPDSETLLGHMHASLFRVLPVSGRTYVSKQHLAFRSSGLASKTLGRTLMLIPFSDIVSASRHQAFRYGYHGLVVTVRGHEELFLELSTSTQRDELLALIDLQLENGKKIANTRVDPDDGSEEHSHALILKDLSERIDCSTDLTSADSSSVSASDLARSDSLLRPDASALVGFEPLKPLSFTMLTIGSRGDVQPYIALAKGLQADGHRVRIATHGEFGDWVKGHGIEFREIGGDPAELMRICVENGTFTLAFVRESITKFRGWLDDLLVSCWDACQGSDVIIESPSAIAGIHVAEALQVPYYRAFTMPWTRTRAYPHAFAVPGNKAGGNYNYMSYVIFDQIFWRASAGQINRWRKNLLKLQPTNLDKLEQHKCPFIYNFSPSLVPRPLDWFEWIHVTGFWFLDNPDNSASRKWQPPEDLVEFIRRARAQDRKLVYIGWGSIVVSDAEAMTQCVLRAVQKSGVCAIISKGWSDRLSSPSKRSGNARVLDPEQMEDVFQVSSVPHDWLFPQIDAACHHGGAGTLGASLRAGLPTIVKPYFGDQFFWGQQVESLGVGTCVKNLTADALAAALKTATTNQKQIERARALGAQIRSENGVGEAIKAIYRDLDYAYSRVKRDTRLATVADTALSGAPATEALVPAKTTETVPAATESAEHTSDEWSDVGAPMSPSMSGSQDGPSHSIVLEGSVDAARSA